MTSAEWESIAVRLELAWPSFSPERREVYFEILADLSASDVRSSVEQLLREDRDQLPAPGIIRQRASASTRATQGSPRSPVPPAEVPADSQSGGKAPPPRPAREVEGVRGWMTGWKTREKAGMAILIALAVLVVIGIVGSHLGLGGGGGGSGNVLPPSSQIERAVYAWDFGGSGMTASSVACTTLAIDLAECEVLLSTGDTVRVRATPGEPGSINLGFAR